MGDDAVSAPPTSWLDLLAESGSAGELDRRAAPEPYGILNPGTIVAL